MSNKLIAIVQEQRDALEAEKNSLIKEREVRQAESDRLVADAESEARDLNSKEAARFREVDAQLREIDATLDNSDEEAPGVEQRLAAADERLKELRGNAEAKERAAKATAEWATRTESSAVSTHARVTRESRTYTPDAEKRGVSFYRDVYANWRGGSPKASERLERHAREARLHEMAGYESRDVGTSAFDGLTVPQYLTDMVAPLPRAMAPVVNICNRHPLPPDGMTVTISRITTGTGVGAQSAQFDDATETNADDTTLTVNVRTYDGMQDVSRQALERSTGVDDILTQDLLRAYWTKLDADIINGAGTNGTHLGILNVSSNVDVTYTDTSPTFAEFYPKLADLIQQVQSGVFMGVSHFVMHPRRWWWLAKELGSTSPLITVPMAGNQQAGVLGGTEYQGAGHSVLGVPVILDGNIVTTNGAGTNEDIVLGVTASELHLWHDPNMPLFIRAEQPLVEKLGVRFVVYGYSAFTAGRYPGAQGNITGSGLSTPSF